MEVAKWAREQGKGIDLRKELIKIAEYLTSKTFPYAIAYGQKSPFCKTYEYFNTF